MVTENIESAKKHLQDGLAFNIHRNYDFLQIICDNIKISISNKWDEKKKN